jgi:nicotinate-nucleotide adenylyltransferase
VALLAAARTAFPLDRLLVLVAGDPGHKTVATPAAVRLELARAAFPGEVVELDAQSRTVDLLRAHPEWEEPVVLIGADQLASFGAWKEPGEVLRLARLGVATRPGIERAELEAVVAGLARPDRVILFEIPPLPIASTELRARLGRGEDLSAVLPPAVLGLLERDGLYREGGGYTGAS